MWLLPLDDADSTHRDSVELTKPCGLPLCSSKLSAQPLCLPILGVPESLGLPPWFLSPQCPPARMGLGSRLPSLPRAQCRF